MPLPLTESKAMKRKFFLCTVLLHLILLTSIAPTRAQQTYFLSVDSVVGIPDTIYDGQSITFSLVFSNLSNLGFQGQVQTMLHFPASGDTITADVTTWPNSFVQAQSQTQVAVSHQFTTQDNNLAIGDNVVVVWPRITTGPVIPPQEAVNVKTISFVMVPPMSVPSLDGTATSKLSIYPNPGQGEVKLSVPGGEELRSFTISDISGKVVHSDRSGNPGLNADLLPAGIYTVTAISASGQPFVGRLMVGNR